MRSPQLWIERGLAVALLGITFSATTALTGCEEMLGLGPRPPLNLVHGRGVLTAVEDIYASIPVRASTEGPLCRLTVHVVPPAGAPFDATVQMNIPYLQIARYQKGSEVEVRYDTVNHYKLWVEGPVEPDAGAFAPGAAGAGDASL